MLRSKNDTVSKKLSNEQAFTLIEIISVLVILGIMAAVAVPKFTNLQDAAREKAGAAAITEAKARASQVFAEQLLANNGNIAAVTPSTVQGGINTEWGDFDVTLTNNSTHIIINVDNVQGVALNANNTDLWNLPTLQ